MAQILIKGKNKTNARHAFVMRKNYKMFGVPTQGLPVLMDFLYEQPYYGRINHNGDAVYLSEAHLSQISNTGEKTIQALDFVVDAFHSFMRDMNKLKQSRCRDKSIFKNIRAVKAWPTGGVHSMYRLYQEMIYRVFVSKYLNGRQRKQNVISLESFMKIFKQFIDKMVPEYPLTRTGLLLSKYSDPLISGLVIETLDADHSNDRLKNRLFIQDSDFSIYRKLAAKNGFMVDKNAPWRLVAKINSPNMFPFMEARNKNYDNIFKRCFYSCYRGGINFAGNDVTELKVFIYSIYSSFVNANPYARKLEQNIDTCLSQRLSGAFTKNIYHLNNKVRTNRVKVFQRPVVTFEEFEKKYDDVFWMKMYMYIRARETYKKWDDRHFTKKVKKMLQVHKTLDLEESLRYINDETK